MTLIGLLVVIVIAGFLLWALGLIPMDENFRKLASGVAILVVVLAVVWWLLGVFGVATNLDLHVR